MDWFYRTQPTPFNETFSSMDESSVDNALCTKPTSHIQPHKSELITKTYNPSKQPWTEPSWRIISSRGRPSVWHNMYHQK